MYRFNFKDNRDILRESLRSRKTAECTHVPLVRPLAIFLNLKRALFSSIIKKQRIVNDVIYASVLRSVRNNQNVRIIRHIIYNTEETHGNMESICLREHGTSSFW